MATTGSVVNANRFDPYRNFKFRILWENKPVLGVRKIGALRRITEAVKHRTGGESDFGHSLPGRTRYEGMTVEFGITHDPEFEAWANMVHSYAGDPAMDLAGYKKELILEIMDESSQVAKRYFLHACWVSEYSAVPELDAQTNAVAIESMKIEMEGWERDNSLTESRETGY